MYNAEVDTHAVAKHSFARHISIRFRRSKRTSVSSSINSQKFRCRCLAFKHITTHKTCSNSEARIINKCFIDTGSRLLEHDAVEVVPTITFLQGFNYFVFSSTRHNDNMFNMYAHDVFFCRYGEPFPHMINFIRDPLSQFISNYHYIRQPNFIRQGVMSIEAAEMVRSRQSFLQGKNAIFI